MNKLGKILVMLMLMTLLVAPSASAQCVRIYNSRGANISECTNDWTSDGAGAATATVSTPASKVLKVETIPGAAGDLTTDLPDAAYDVTLTDGYSLDITAGGLANRSGTVAENIVPSVPYPIRGNLTATISAAGAANSGRIIVTVEE